LEEKIIRLSTKAMSVRDIEVALEEL